MKPALEHSGLQVLNLEWFGTLKSMARPFLNHSMVDFFADPVPTAYGFMFK